MKFTENDERKLMRLMEKACAAGEAVHLLSNAVYFYFLQSAHDNLAVALKEEEEGSTVTVTTDAGEFINAVGNGIAMLHETIATDSSEEAANAAATMLMQRIGKSMAALGAPEGSSEKMEDMSVREVPNGSRRTVH